MGRKITLFRFDVDADPDVERRVEEERVTVERPAEFAADEDEDEDGAESGGSLLRRLLLGGALLAVGAVGGFLLRGTEAGSELALKARSALPFAGDGPATEPTPDERAERGTASLVGFAFLVSLTALSKRAYRTRPLDGPGPGPRRD